MPQLTTTAQVMLAVQDYSTDPVTVSRYDLLRRQVEQAVISYCKWNILQDTVTEFYDGNGYQDIILRQPFVSNVASVYLDQTGFYGAGNNAFASTTLLTAGSDYALVLEGATISKNGLLRRLQVMSYWFPSSWLFLQSSGGLAFRQTPYWQVGAGNIQVTYTFGFVGTLALAAPYITWSGGYATLTTAAAHGFTAGMRCSIYGTDTGYDGVNYRVAAAPTPTTLTIPFLASQGSVIGGTVNGIPQDIQAAVEAAVGIFRNSVKYGWPVTSESMGDYNYSLSISRDVELMTVRQLLSQYRDMPLIGF